MADDTTPEDVQEFPNARTAAEHFIDRAMTIPLAKGNDGSLTVATVAAGLATLALVDAMNDVAAATREATAYAKSKDKPPVKRTTTRTTAASTKPATTRSGRQTKAASK